MTNENNRPMTFEKKHPVRVVIIEDNRFIRNGMELMLKNEPEFELIGAYPNCEKAFDLPYIGKADIVLMDIRLPGVSGLEGIKLLRKKYPDTAVLVCTAYEDDENVYQAIASGAVGFLSKKSSPSELLHTLQSVARGGSPMTPTVARKILNSYRNPLSGRKKNIDLPQIARNILEMLSLGKSYTTIANELSVSERDVLIRNREIYETLQTGWIEAGQKKKRR